MGRGRRSTFSKPAQAFLVPEAALRRPAIAPAPLGSDANPIALVPAWPGAHKARPRYRFDPVVEIDADGERVHYVHPYDGVPRSKWRQRARQLHATLPFSDEVVIDVVHRELEAIVRWFKTGSEFGLHEVKYEDLSDYRTQIHDNLVEGTVLALGDVFRGEVKGRIKTEKDLMCLISAVHGVEVKCIRGEGAVEWIIGNKSAATRREPGKPGKAKAQDSFYLAVAWDPGPRDGEMTIHRIVAGYLSPEDWEVPTKTADGKAAGGQRARVSFTHEKLIPIYVSPEEKRRERDKRRREREAKAKAAAAAAQPEDAPSS